MPATIDRPKSLADLVKEFEGFARGATQLWMGKNDVNDAYWAGRLHAYRLCARMLAARLQEIRLWELEHPES